MKKFDLKKAIIIPVTKSSHITELAYDKSSLKLHVTFTDDSKYEYRNICTATFNQLVSANNDSKKSVGETFDKWVEKEHYSYSELTDMWKTKKHTVTSKHCEKE